jgi:hypothetical protein
MHAGKRRYIYVEANLMKVARPVDCKSKKK